MDTNKNKEEGISDFNTIHKNNFLEDENMYYKLLTTCLKLRIKVILDRLNEVEDSLEKDSLFKKAFTCEQEHYLIDMLTLFDSVQGDSETEKIRVKNRVVQSLIIGDYVKNFLLNPEQAPDNVESTD